MTYIYNSLTIFFKEVNFYGQNIQTNRLLQFVMCYL